MQTLCGQVLAKEGQPYDPVAVARMVDEYAGLPLAVRAHVSAVLHLCLSHNNLCETFGSAYQIYNKFVFCPCGDETGVCPEASCHWLEDGNSRAETNMDRFLEHEREMFCSPPPGMEKMEDAFLRKEHVPALPLPSPMQPITPRPASSVAVGTKGRKNSRPRSGSGRFARSSNRNNRTPTHITNTSNKKASHGSPKVARRREPITPPSSPPQPGRTHKRHKRPKRFLAKKRPFSPRPDPDPDLLTDPDPDPDVAIASHENNAKAPLSNSGTGSSRSAPRAARSGRPRRQAASPTGREARQRFLDGH